MAVDEAARTRLVRELDRVLSEEGTATLMALLPVSAEDIATKADLALLKAELEATIANAINAQTRTLLLGFLAANLAVAGIVLGLS
jgi:hypothetical protein